MAADIAPILDDNSLVEIRPVTLDAGVPKSYGVLMPVRLADAKTYFGSGGVPAAATATTIGGVKQAASQPAAAGANPTKAEYDALIAALKAAGIMVSP